MALLSVSKFRSYLETQFNNFANRISSVFSRKDETVYSLDLGLDPETFVLSISLKDIYGNVLDTKEKDLPIESMIVGIAVSKDKSEITLKFKGGESTTVKVTDLFSGLLPDTVTIAGLNVKDNPTAEQLVNAMKLSTVAKTGSYNDLSDKPAIPTLSGTRLKIGDKFEAGTDGEGGFINMWTSGTTKNASNYWQQDCYVDNIFRISHYDADLKAWEPVFTAHMNPGKGVPYVSMPAIYHGAVSTTITPRDDGGYDILQSGNDAGGFKGKIKTSVAKTSETVTTITQTATGISSDETVWTTTTTITKNPDTGVYTIDDKGIEVGAWAQAAFIVSELT